MERAVTIAAPPDAVWRVLTDLERWPGWTASVRKLERLDDAPLAIGNRARLWLAGAPGATVWRVTALEPGRSFSWAYAAPGFRSTADHELTPDGDGTRVTLRVTYHGALAGIAWLLAMRRISRRNLELESEGLKRASESHVAE